MLDIALPLDLRRYPVVELEPDQSFQIVPVRDAFNRAFFVVSDPFDQIARNA
jgi:hypothetical protein